MNITNVSENNKTEVLNTIIHSKTLLSRAEISRKLNLNKATVSRIINELIAENIVYEFKKGDSTIKGGKKPLLIDVNNKNILIGLSVRKYKYEYIFTNIRGDRLISDNYTPDQTLSFNENLKKFFKFITKKYSDFTPLAGSLVVPGIVDSNQGTILYSGEFDLTNFNISSTIKKYFHFPFFLENDANASAIAFKIFENSSLNNFIFLLLRVDTKKKILYTGAGIVLNKTLIKGDNNFAGEFILFDTSANNTIILKNNQWYLKNTFEEELLKKLSHVIFFLNTSAIIINNSDEFNFDSLIKKLNNEISRLKRIYTGFDTDIIIAKTDRIHLKGSIALLIDKITANQIPVSQKK